MLLLRASLLLLVVAVIFMTRCEGSGEDRIGTISSLMADMGKGADSSTDSVKEIYRMEQDTAEHVSKTDDRVAEIETQMKTKFVQLEIKVGIVKYDVVSFTWKFIGHGYQGSCTNLQINL